jgi:hypothetical protein
LNRGPSWLKERAVPTELSTTDQDFYFWCYLLDVSILGERSCGMSGLTDDWKTLKVDNLRIITSAAYLYLIRLFEKFLPGSMIRDLFVKGSGCSVDFHFSQVEVVIFLYHQLITHQNYLYVKLNPHPKIMIWFSKYFSNWKQISLKCSKVPNQQWILLFNQCELLETTVLFLLNCWTWVDGCKSCLRFGDSKQNVYHTKSET